MLRRIGIVVGLIGTISGLVGSLWFMLLPTPDANIGAGLLVVAGITLTTIGLAVSAFLVILNRREP